MGMTRSRSETLGRALLRRAGWALAAAALLLLLGAAPATAERRLECKAVHSLVRSFLQNHVRFQQLDPELEQRTIDTYVRRLDPSRTLLLESEAAQAREALNGIFAKVSSGQCEVLGEVSAGMVDHHRRTEEFVRQVVSAPDFELDPSVTLVVDPDKRGQPKTPEEREAINRSLVHFQLSNYLAAGTPLDKAKERLIHRYELRTRRAAELDSEDVYAGFLDSFASSLDPHSNYLSAEAVEDFRISMSLSLEGIGVALSERDGFAVAERIIPGGPADRHGVLRPKDKIIAVAQEGGDPQDIIDMSLRDAVALIRGRAGTRVSLTVLREGESTSRFPITIERDKIDLSERAAKLRFEERQVGERKLKLAVLELTSFYGDATSATDRQCPEDVKQLLAEARAQGADGLLLDLSSNGGGVLEHAVRISGFFVRSGEIVRIMDSQGQSKPLWDRDDKVLWSGPMVVHTSRVSASASEILAGALKDYQRAVITGDDHTFGKGTVQTVSSLPPGLGALKITTALFFRPGGQSTQKDGVTSDVEIPSIFSRNGFGEASQDYALDGERIKPFLSRSANGRNGSKGHWKTIDATLLTKLRERSKVRIDGSEEFAELREKLAEADDGGELRLAELMERQGEEAAVEGENAAGAGAEAKGETPDIPVPQVEEAINVLADLVIEQES
jgi:carboxyl-terminal processing protease